MNETHDCFSDESEFKRPFDDIFSPPVRLPQITRGAFSCPNNLTVAVVGVTSSESPSVYVKFGHPDTNKRIGVDKPTAKMLYEFFYKLHESL